MDSAPLLVGLAEASARGVITTGPHRGRRVVRVRGLTAEVDAFVMGPLCAQVEGYNLQAATRIDASDREGVERMKHRDPGLCRNATALMKGRDAAGSPPRRLAGRGLGLHADLAGRHRPAETALVRPIP